MLDYSYPPCTPTYYSLFLNDLSKSTTRLLLKSSFFFLSVHFPPGKYRHCKILLFLVAVICKPAVDNMNMSSAAPVTWSSQKHLGKRPWMFLFCFCYFLSVSSNLLLVPTISWVFKNKKIPVFPNDTQTCEKVIPSSIRNMTKILKHDNCTLVACNTQ